MRTYGPGSGNGKWAGGDAISQKCCWAICVAFGVGLGSTGAAVETTVRTVVGRKAPGVGVPLPPWVLTLDKVAAVVGTNAASVGVPLPIWVMTIDGVGVPLPPWVSTLDKVAVVGRGARGNAPGVGLPTTLDVSALDNVASAATGTSGTVA